MAFSQSPPPLVGYSTIFFCGYDAHLVAGIWTSSVCVQHKGNKDTTKVICGKDVAVMNSIVPNGRAAPESSTFHGWPVKFSYT